MTLTFSLSKYAWAIRASFMVAGLIAFSVIAFGGAVQFVQARTLAAPTVITPTQGLVRQSSEIVVRGITKPHTKVAVFIDGSMHGFARVQPGVNENAAWSFGYVPQGLSPGVHAVSVRAIAEDDSIRSARTKNISFTVEKPIGKPVLVGVSGVEPGAAYKPVITGVAPQHTVVDVYANDRYLGSTGVSQNDVVIGDFAFVLPQNMKSGRYSFTAVTRFVRADGSTTYSQVSQPLVVTVPVYGTIRAAIEQARPSSGVPAATVELANADADQEKTEENKDAVEDNNAKVDESINTEDRVDESNVPFTALQVIGWIALFIAAGLFVYQLRRHRQDIDVALEEGVEPEEKEDNQAEDTQNE